MIRETILTHWTRVTRLVRGQVVQTTCCCPPSAAGGGRGDCMRAKGCKTPCRCACHGHEVRRGLRFREADGAVLPDRIPVMSEFYQNAEMETAELVRRLEAQGEFERRLKTMNIDELIDMVESEIHALNSTGHCGHRFHVSLISAELIRRGGFAT